MTATITKEAKKARKRARKLLRSATEDAIRYRLAEHLFERGWVASPTNALIASEMILADLRPMIEHEVKTSLGLTTEHRSPKGAILNRNRSERSRRDNT